MRSQYKPIANGYNNRNSITWCLNESLVQNIKGLRIIVVLLYLDQVMLGHAGPAFR